MRHNNASRANRLFVRDLCAVLVTVFAAAGAVVVASAQPAVTPAAEKAATQPVSDSDRISFSTGRNVASGATGAAKANGVTHPRTKARTARAQEVDTGFWFYDATTEIYYDDDQDGYFYGLTVYFDADTDYFDANVYALLYLSRDGGPWELYYETNVFAVSGATGDDEYLVETELFEGYPRGYYDVLIELYDADFGDFVAEIGPEDVPDLSLLPLEDQQKDAPFIETVIVTGSGGGGGAAGLSIVLLGALALARRRRHAGGGA